MEPIKKIVPSRSYTGERWRTNTANKVKLMVDFNHCCAYCDDKDVYAGGYKNYHVEHFAPKDKFPELQYNYENLLYSCPYCNISKSNKWPSKSYKENVMGNVGFIDPCSKEYSQHLVRNYSGKITYTSELGEYMYFALKLYLKRHEIIFNLNRIDVQLKKLKQEIFERKNNGKCVTKLNEAYKELCVVFYEYFDLFTEDCTCC